MEFQYKRIVHYLGQLVLHQNFDRAIYLGNKILQKGFKTNQLIIMLSYAIKMSQGNKQAIEFIQKMSSFKNQRIRQEQKQVLMNPLMQFAKGQYYGELKKYQESCKCYKQLLFQQRSTANTSSQSISTPISLISQNYSQISKKKQFKLSPFSEKMKSNVIVNINEDIKSLIEEVNIVTKQYRNQITKHEKNKEKIHINLKQKTKQREVFFNQKEYFNRVSQFSQLTVIKTAEKHELSLEQMESAKESLQILKQFQNKYNKIKKKFIKKVYDCEFTAIRMQRQNSTHKKKSVHDVKKSFQNKTNYIYKSLSKQKFSMHSKLRKPLKIQPNKQNKQLQTVIKKGSEIKQILIQINQFVKFIRGQILQKQKTLQKFQYNHKRTIKNSFEDQQNCVPVN